MCHVKCSVRYTVVLINTDLLIARIAWIHELEQDFEMKLFIVRHGETDYNRKRVMQGYGEVPLNDRGIRQATLLAQRLREEKLDRILCSDLRRAVMTACIVASHTGVGMDYDPALRERDPGALVGQSYDAEPRFFTDETFIPPQGEGVLEFRARVRRAFEALAADTRNAGKRIAVITHGLVCHAFVVEFFGESAAKGVGARNASVTLADFACGQWGLITRDCAAHLADDEPPKIVIAGA